MRNATITRKTLETQVRIEIDLDGQGQSEIATGIGFLDHMLTQIALHGLLDLSIHAQGDLEIDPHHTMEDVALVLGEAVDQALGERKGIFRMGSAVVPMDEALCEVILDFSGRPYCVFNGEWTGAYIGDIPVTLIEHFFYTLSMGMKAAVHLTLRYGRDDHHKAEALFKALGRALRTASRLDPGREGQVPSTKDVL